MASPVLLLLTTVKNSDKRSTIFLAGYDPDTGLGGPPKIINGRNIIADNEIVLDNSFALNNGFNVGDKLIIIDDTLTITGLSTGTNAFVIQYAFTTLAKAQSLLGFPGIVTCYQVRVKNSSDMDKTAEELQKLIGGTTVYNHSEFLANNIKEMESGFLPILYAVAVLGAIVLTTVLSLILSINILERKKDFAVMKILGAPALHKVRLTDSLLPGQTLQFQENGQAMTPFVIVQNKPGGKVDFVYPEDSRTGEVVTRIPR